MTNPAENPSSIPSSNSIANSILSLQFLSLGTFRPRFLDDDDGDVERGENFRFDIATVSLATTM